MKRNTRLALVAALLLVPATVIALRAVQGRGAHYGRGGAAAAQDSACTAPSSWFPTTPQPVNFAVSSTSNCSFHQYAWQQFLWLTQDSDADSSQPNFLTFAYPQDLFVTSPLPYPGRAEGTSMLRLIPRDIKNEDDFFGAESINQAGSGGVLIDQQGQVVFYAQLLNETWYDFAVDSGYNLPAKRAAAPDSLNFPTGGTGSLELKTAWRVAQTADSTFIPNASSRFITTQGMVPTVTIQNGEVHADTTKMIPATLALVGMHVVGTVNGHPEFIWASFEHVDNAPLCSATPQGATNPATGNAWSLYTANLQCTGDDGSPCNQVPSTASFSPTSVCQVNAYGDSSSTSQNTLNIQSLNKSVHAQLGSSSILQNYYLLGGQWTSPGGLPAIFADSADGDTTNIHGSGQLANTTMESFTQDATCFNCHNPDSASSTPFFRKNISVSHAWPLTP